MDDDPSLLLLVSEVARLGLGAEVTKAASGTEAKGLLEAMQPPPDLVVLDYTMPGLSGLEVIQWARAQPGLARVPMLLFTAVDSMSPQEAQRAGATGVIVKPMPPRRLIERLKEHLPP